MAARRPERAVPSPNGCRWCGADARFHMQRWVEPVGWHQWAQPTDAQRKQRMFDRRERFSGVGRRDESATQQAS